WTKDLFGEFDGRVIRYGGYSREARKPERIGKKYQWIAFYEGLARIADNFKFEDDDWWTNANKYVGAWQKGYLRNIDPSNLLSIGRRKAEEEESVWWFPTFRDWQESELNIDWLKSDLD